MSVLKIYQALQEQLSVNSTRGGLNPLFSFVSSSKAPRHHHAPSRAAVSWLRRKCGREEAGGQTALPAVAFSPSCHHLLQTGGRGQ